MKSINFWKIQVLEKTIFVYSFQLSVNVLVPGWWVRGLVTYYPGCPTIPELHNNIFTSTCSLLGYSGKRSNTRGQIHDSPWKDVLANQVLLQEFDQLQGGGEHRRNYWGGTKVKNVDLFKLCIKARSRSLVLRGHAPWKILNN